MYALLAALALAAPVHDAGNGISIRVPPGWHVLAERLTPCTNPIERVDVTGPRGALVMLQEALDRKYVTRFPARPRRFGVRGAPNFIACCAPESTGKGWMLHFRDAGRSFYAYVYPGRGARTRQALGILDSLRVERRR
jgi:hypothetical protein